MLSSNTNNSWRVVVRAWLQKESVGRKYRIHSPRAIVLAWPDRNAQADAGKEYNSYIYLFSIRVFLTREHLSKSCSSFRSSCPVRHCQLFISNCCYGERGIPKSAKQVESRKTHLQPQPRIQPASSFAQARLWRQPWHSSPKYVLPILR